MTIVTSARTVDWLSAPAAIAVSPDQVHIWRAGLDLPGDALQQAQQTLSPHEHARAHRFRFEQDRKRYVAAHGALRAILARYLNTTPERVLLEQAPGGKPRLANAGSNRAVQFSMADSEDVALYAVAMGADVGVDVELMRPIAEVDQIAARFFSPAESAALAALAEEQRLPAFYTCWTIKEAYTKAIGAGLAYPLDKVEVSVAGSRLAALDGDANEAARWFVKIFCPEPGYQAAVVVRCQIAGLSFWQYAERQRDRSGRL